MAPRHADALRSDAPDLPRRRPQRRVLPRPRRAGLRAASSTKLGVEHTLELFDGTHGGIGYRYPGAIRELVLALHVGGLWCATQRSLPAKLRAMTTTADHDLLFSGPGRAGRARPHEGSHAARARRAVPAADRGAQSAAERVPRDDGRGGAGRGRQTLPSGPLAGVPIAIKDDLPVAGQATTRGSRSYGPPAPGGRRGGAPAARGRRDPDRDHQRSRADDLPVDRDRRPTASPATRGI